MQVIEDLKASAPAKEGEKKTKTESAHLSLIACLESRLETIDNELSVSLLLRAFHSYTPILIIGYSSLLFQYYTLVENPEGAQEG